MGSVTAKRSLHLHLPVCAAATRSPGALPAPHSTPNPHRAHLGVGCCCSRTAYTPSTSALSQTPERGPPTSCASAAPKPARSLSPDPKGCAGCSRPPPGCGQLSDPSGERQGWSARLSLPPLTVPGFCIAPKAAQNLANRRPLARVVSRRLCPMLTRGAVLLWELSPGRCPPLLNSDLT